jgi:hypothetical protein
VNEALIRKYGEEFTGKLSIVDKETSETVNSER